MIGFIFSYVLVFAAAFFNALMDTFENTPNFNKSIFKNMDKTFWCKDVSWDHVKHIFSYPLDAWHLSKSAMIVCVIAAIVLFEQQHDFLVHVISLGVIWNISFWLFYTKILRGKL